MKLDTLNKIRRLYSDTSIYKLEEFPAVSVNVVPTGSLMLDKAIGTGGIPRGRVTEVLGLEGTGKTTLCLHIISEAQKLGLQTIFIDVENAIDLKWARKCGVNTDELYLSQPSTAEEALGIADIVIKDGAAGLIVIDSAASLAPECEFNDDKTGGLFQDENTTGMRRAKLLYHFFRKNAAGLRKNDIALVFTNQLRDNTKSMYGGTVPTCGKALKYYASVRMELKTSKAGEIESGGISTGREIEVAILKNRVGPPLQTAKFTISYEHGIWKAGDILDFCLEYGIIHKRASYYIYGEEVVGQGKQKTMEALDANQELLDALEQQCKEVINVQRNY